jgi:hypothetical protein
MCVRVYVRAWVSACACVRVWGGVSARTWECVRARVVLLIYHATRTHHFFFGISGYTTFFDIINGTIFRRNVTEYCHTCKNVFMHSSRYSNRILMKREFSRQIFEKKHMSEFIKIRPVGAELFHTDDRRTERRRTDGWKNVMQLIVAYCNFAMAPRNARCERVMNMDIANQK